MAQALGQWFSWLDRTGNWVLEETPHDRLTEQRLFDFVDELQGRVAPWSAAMMLGALKRGYDVLAPDTGRSWLSQLCSDLKATARSSRNRFAHLAMPDEIFDLGLSLMEEAMQSDAPPTHLVSCLARDGLMIAMLVCFPVRIANFAAIEIGKHLTFQEDRYVLRFEPEETKTGRIAEGELPSSLTGWIDWYLDVPRRQLLSASSSLPTSGLWVNRWGLQLQENGVRTQIEKRTKANFGLHIWPHLFRAAAATGIVDLAPTDIAVAAELLGHSSIQTTEQHYILARGNLAHQAVHASLGSARREAMERLRKH